MRNARIVAAITVFVAIVLSGCVSSSGLEDFTDAPLYGMVYDYDGQPVESAEVTIDGVLCAKSDTNGRFCAPKVTKTSHECVVARKAYETLTISFEFSQPTLVLYAKIASCRQLVNLALDSMDKRRWDEANGYIDRALAVDGADPLALYVKGLYYYHTGHYGEALTLLEKLIADGFDNAAIRLLLADVYQYGLLDTKKAIAQLERAMQIQGKDEVLEKRIAELRAAK